MLIALQLCWPKSCSVIPELDGAIVGAAGYFGFVYQNDLVHPLGVGLDAGYFVAATQIVYPNAPAQTPRHN